MPLKCFPLAALHSATQQVLWVETHFSNPGTMVYEAYKGSCVLEKAE